MRHVIRKSVYDYDRSAAYGAQWQKIELILHWLLVYNIETHAREGKE